MLYGFFKALISFNNQQRTILHDLKYFLKWKVHNLDEKKVWNCLGDPISNSGTFQPLNAAISKIYSLTHFCRLILNKNPVSMRPGTIILSHTFLPVVVFTNIKYKRKKPFWGKNNMDDILNFSVSKIFRIE